MAYFTPKLKPTRRPRNYRSNYDPVFIFQDALKPQTRILFGALVQLILCALFPMKWAAVPTAILILNSIITTIIQTTIPGRNTFQENSVLGRTTAQILSQEGQFGPNPGDQPVVVFNLGIQLNHPLGVLAPGAQPIFDAFVALEKELLSKRDEYGFLTMSHWRGSERGSNNTLLMTFYFRHLEGVHRLAHEDIHRKIWKYYDEMKLAHIGVFHETFCVPAKEYESMYVNCSPVLFGRGQARRLGGEGGESEKDGMEMKEEEMWTNFLVSADTPALKTQYSRLSRYENGVMKQ